MNAQDIIDVIAAKVIFHHGRKGLNEEYTWYYLREQFPTAPDDALEVYAARILQQTGL